MSAVATAAPDRAQHQRRDFAIAGVLMLALIAAAPFFVYPFFVMEMLCVALFACAFNLLIGYVGLLSFGHAMFFGMASYVSAHAAKVWELDPLLAILCGVAVAAAMGLVAGALAIRSTGIYFAMITVALSQMVYFFCVEAPFTHGEDGIQSVPQGRVLGLFDISNTTNLYIFVAVIFVLGFLFVYRTINSPFGEILKAIRENQPRAISLGYRVPLYKLAAFVLSAGLAGLAGATKALVVQNASLSDVGFQMSGEVVLMTLLGGMGTLYGPVVGAVVVVSMQNYLAQYGEWVTVIQGAVFVACVLLFRRGIVGEIAKWAGLAL
jgi:branched-chain amino acid transport system permease protein